MLRGRLVSLLCIHSCLTSVRFSKMAELDIPIADQSTTLPSTTERGIGATLPDAAHQLANGSNGNEQRSSNERGPVTMVIIGAGQRGQVRTTLNPSEPL